MRIVMSPKVPIVMRGRDISARRRLTVLGFPDGSCCWAIQERTSEIANFRCLPNRYVMLL